MTLYLPESAAARSTEELTLAGQFSQAEFAGDAQRLLPLSNSDAVVRRSPLKIGLKVGDQRHMERMCQIFVQGF